MERASFVNEKSHLVMLHNIETWRGKQDMSTTPKIEKETNRNIIFEKAKSHLELLKKNELKANDFVMMFNCFEIRVLLGQRFTQGSITDCNFKIPERKELIELYQQPYNETGLSVGARALTKHYLRSTFWNRPRGKTDQKNLIALQQIETILENVVWWNMFYHFKHEYVLEIRTEGGYGARWGKEKFIGFVEPFFMD